MTTVKQAYAELLKDLVSFDSISNKSNLPCIDFLSHYLSERRFRTQMFFNEDKTKANLVAAIGPDISGGLMLAGHTDVVPVDRQRWDFNPFELIEMKGRLIGRGTSDMKGFIALVCDVIDSVSLNQLKKPLYLVFTYDEEVGCFGAKSLQKELFKYAQYIDFALIGEPTNSSLVNTHKGMQATKTQFMGKPVHSSAPHLGSNAIMAASAFLQQLPSFLPKEENSAFTPAYTTFNAGMIKGGSAVNIIAEHCQLDWECRPLPGIQEKEIAHIMDKLTEEVRSSSKVDVHHHIISFVPGLTTKNNQQSIEFVKQFLPESIKVTTAPFVTEAGIFEQASIPTIVFGPGELEQAHQPNESVSIEAMENYRRFLFDLIQHHCH